MKRLIRSVEFTVLILAVLVFALVTSNKPGITGFVTTEVHSQKLDIELAESSLVSIESISDSPIRLSSLKLSGEVRGNGLVEIYLTDGNHKKLVYTNLQKKKKGMIEITGRATGGVRVYKKAKLSGSVVRPEGYEVVQEAFNQACVETCSFDDGSQKYYDLEVWVQSGAKVRITELRYSLIE